MSIGLRGRTQEAMETSARKSLEVGGRGVWVSLHLRVENYDSVLLEPSEMTNTALHALCGRLCGPHRNRTRGFVRGHVHTFVMRAESMFPAAKLRRPWSDLWAAESKSV